MRSLKKIKAEIKKLQKLSGHEGELQKLDAALIKAQIKVVKQKPTAQVEKKKKK